MKNTLSSLLSIIVCTIGVAHIVPASAAVPINPPVGAMSGGTFSQYFTNIIGAGACAANTVITGFDNTLGPAYGARTCTPVSGLLRTFLAGVVPTQPGKYLAGFDGAGDPVYDDAAISTWEKNGTSLFYNSGSVGIGTNVPGAKLTIGTNLAGSAMSTTLKTNAGPLGNTAGNELILGSIGFTSSNNSALGIRAVRTSNGADWTTTSIGLSMDVDNTPRAGGSALWIGSNGGVGIGTNNPTARLEVAGLIKSTNNGAAYLQGGDDATLNDVNVANTVAVVGMQDATRGSLQLGNNAGSYLAGRLGNIGIGTVNPISRLQVNDGPVMAAGYRRVGTFYAQHPVIQFKGISDTNNSAFIGYDAQSISEGLRFWVKGTTDDVGSAINVMNLSATGNVGIGTANPTHKLDVTGNARIIGNSNFALALTGSYDLALETGPTNRKMLFGGNGNGYSLQSTERTTGNTIALALNPLGGDVGIGTTQPTQKLDVNGQVRIRGGVPGVGKILTSTADGTATWENLPSTVTWNTLTGKPTWMQAQNLTATAVNFNNSQPSGFYEGNNTPNSPIGGTWVNMINVRHSNTSNDYGFQIAQGYWDPNLWHRNYWGGTGNNDGTFAAWAKIWDDQNDGPGSGLDADTLDGRNSSAFFSYDGWVNSPGYNADTIGGNKSGFSYSNNAAWTGPMTHFDASNYGLQFSASYNGGGENLSFRTKNGDINTWNGWNQIITTDNLASFIGASSSRAYPRKVGGSDINFNWSGQGGQPPWLWGGSDGTNMYVYDPYNFNVNTAGSVRPYSAYTNTGALSGRSGRVGLYNYHSYPTPGADPNGATGYAATVGFGNGDGGSVEISGDWANGAGGGMWYRSLRDCCTNWTGWTRFIDTANISTYAVDRTSNQDITGIKYFTSNKGAASTVGGNTDYQLQAYSNDGGAAGMSFHRGGAFAVNMGLDPDNVFRIGGWSAPANRLELNMGGDLTVAGSVNATNNVNISAKNALRGNDAWLRLNQDGAFTSGVHTPGLLYPGSLNVGGVAGAVNPGWGNALFSGNVSLGTSSSDGKLTVRGGKVSIGDATTEDFLPAAMNWDYTLQLNGVDTTSIGFHDGAASVSSIRYANNLFTIGGNDGWGVKNVNMPGNVEVGGTIKINGGGVGSGKVLTSDATGNASWQTPAASGGGGQIYPDMTPTNIFPTQPSTGKPPYWETFSFTRNINAKCTSGRVKLIVTDRESGDWPAVGSSYIFGTGNRTINTAQTLFDQFGNRLFVDVGGWMDGGILKINSITAAYFDEGLGSGGVQMSAECTPDDGEIVIGTMCDAGPCGGVNNVSITKNVTDYGLGGRGNPTLVRVIHPTGLDGDYMNAGQEIHYLFGPNYPLKFNKRYMTYNAGANQIYVTVNLTAGNQVEITTEVYDGSAGAAGNWAPTYIVYFGTVTSPDRTHAAIVPDEADAVRGISYFSEKWCTDRGGTIVDIGADRSAVCRVNGGSCGVIVGTAWTGPFTKWKNWSRTTAITAGGPVNAACTAEIPPVACTTGSHPWSNTVNETCASTRWNWSLPLDCYETAYSVPATINETGCF